MLYTLRWLYTYVANVCFNYFTLFQYVTVGVAPHVLWLSNKHALHAPIQNCLSLSCRPTPTVERARNGLLVPKWLSILWSKCMQSARAGQDPTDAESGTPPPPGSVPHNRACSRVNTWECALCSLPLSRIGVRALYSLPLSRMQLGGPTHMLSWAGTTGGGGVRCSSRRKRCGAQQEEEARGTAAHMGRHNNM
jgi:hypothetical protein